MTPEIEAEILAKVVRLQSAAKRSTLPRWLKHKAVLLSVI